MKIFKYFFLFYLFSNFSYGIYQNTNSKKMKAESEVALKGLILEMRGIENRVPFKVELEFSQEGTDVEFVFNHDNVELSSDENSLVNIGISKGGGENSKSIFNITFKSKKLKDSEIELLKSGKSILEDTPNNEEMKIIRLTAIYR
ncbi:hypothetical protein [uncultured Fusobacterium sp.]|uniref:hypothetical protein n=1 Tax=uncultured Fusobacterium sp. TaxID=159267 RepID=UPI0025EF614C|nr:hypothetical protein [uncultured Fusobacterium sp.]